MTTATVDLMTLADALDNLELMNACADNTIIAEQIRRLRDEAGLVQTWDGEDEELDFGPEIVVQRPTWTNDGKIATINFGARA